ncbi:hypothetical protein [Azospirillum halopraeferens]|uniref:hypothetical protein n=1 Tax=Azospirillum halopraeferens TaxID=34010 RepID=UPI0012EB8FB5|nr:hypothetical protein [Azospirillum halopraeferens]
MADLSLTCTVELVEYPPRWDGPAGDALARVLSDVATERVRQVARGYDAAHDDQHTNAGFEDHLFERMLLLDAARPEDRAHHRRRWVQIAALAVAGIERLDRLHATDGGAS